MKPPFGLQNWQGFAQGLAQCDKGFAPKAAAGQTDHTGLTAATTGSVYLNCYPSPIFWPAPQRIRPFLNTGSVASRTQRSADLGGPRQIAFALTRFVAIIEPIKTRTRGKKRCRSNHLSLSGQRPCLWLVACKTRPRAVLAAQLWAHLLLTRWTKTLSQGRPSGQQGGRRPAISPVRSTVSKVTEHRAFQLGYLNQGHAGIAPRMVFSLLGGTDV